MGNRGLTIAIVAIIVSVVGVYEIFFSGPSGPDAQRIADMHSLRDALTAYYKDHNSYPATPGAVNCERADRPDVRWNNVQGLANALVPKYLKSIPAEPNPASCDMNYLYVAPDANNYGILVHLDNIDTAKFHDHWCIGAAGGPVPVNAYGHDQPCP